MHNATLNLVGQVIPLLVGVATIPLIIRGLGTDRFGILSLVWVAWAYFSLFDIGLGRATTKYVAEALGRGETERVPYILWTTVALQSMLGVLGVLVVVVITPLLVQRVLNIPLGLIDEARGAFYLLALSIPLVLVSASFRGMLEAAQRFDLVNAVKVPSDAATFLLPLVGVLLGFHLPGIVALLAAARAVTLVAFLGLCLTTFPYLREEFASHRDVIRPLLSYGGWITVSNVVGPILVYLDRFVIGALLTMSAVTYYSAPYEVVTRLWIIPSSLVLTLFPAFSELGSVGNRNKLGVLFARAVKYLFILMGCVIVVLLVFAKEILQIWLGTDFAERSTLAFQVLAFGILMNSLAQVPYALLQGLGRPDMTAKLHLIELPLHATLAWLLVKQWGITGAAVAWTLRATLDALLLFAAAHRIGCIASSSLFENGILRALCAISAFGAAVLAIGNFVSSLPLRAVIVIFTAILLTPMLWQYVFDAVDRKQATSLFYTAGIRRPNQSERRDTG